jgi:nicotinate-nucleotide pyrophosphorylase (carboxylating)
MGLWDMALIKENHVRMAGGISNAVKMVRRSCGAHFPVEVEVTSMTELEEALSVAPDRIMLDNMTVDETAKAVKFARNIAPSVKLESSGGITLENIRKYGLTGVDYISVGAVTHSAPALDITFLLDW